MNIIEIIGLVLIVGGIAFFLYRRSKKPEPTSTGKSVGGSHYKDATKP